MFEPEIPVKVPILAIDAGSPGTGTGSSTGFDATTTFLEVINVSSGAIGLMWRTL
jgi:hypothetical protein